LVRASLEGGELFGQLLEAGGVVGVRELALHDDEVDLDLA
jgi:hypothetical protein